MMIIDFSTVLLLIVGSYATGAFTGPVVLWLWKRRLIRKSQKGEK